LVVGPGEILRMTHIARGLDSDGVLLLDIVVNGHILQLPTGVDIFIKVLEGFYFFTAQHYYYCYMLWNSQ